MRSLTGPSCEAQPMRSADLLGGTALELAVSWVSIPRRDAQSGQMF